MARSTRWRSNCVDEFALIKKIFAPLAQNFPPALGLRDDAAVLTVPAGKELAVTADMLVAGVHFFGHEAPGLIARKALRTNLSDLAAMGATPDCYFLGLSLPKETAPEWVEAFARGLAEDQREFSIALAGGDTTATPGPLTIAITAHGQVPQGKSLLRSGAKPGDLVCVSGTIGDAALGLALLQPAAHCGLPPVHSEAEAFLIQRYLLPQPRVALGEKLRGHATACMDISDGLIQDLEHLCAASGVGAVIDASRIPFSDTAKTSAHFTPENCLTGGDDYELLFTVSPSEEPWLRTLPVPCAVIGKIAPAPGIIVQDENGTELNFAAGGYRHFR